MASCTCCRAPVLGQSGPTLDTASRSRFAASSATILLRIRGSAGQPPPHFHKSGAGGVINGKFYVTGGLNGFQPVADLDVYDPATNSWKTLAPMPTGGRAIGAVLGGKLFVIVGSRGTELHTYAYSPGTNTWKSKASPTWEHDALVRVTLNGRTHLLAVGGSHGSDLEISNDSELYTP